MPEFTTAGIISELQCPEWEKRFIALKRMLSPSNGPVFHRWGTRDRMSVAGIVMDLLEDENPHVRSQALAVLAALGCKESVEKVVTALADPNEWVRIQAGEALGRLGDSSVAGIAAQYLQSEDDAHVRATLVQTIGNIGDDKMLPVLLLYLEDSDARVRANCVEALTKLKIEKDRLKEALLKITNDPSNRVRANIAITLLELGENRGKEIIGEMVESKDECMRASAAYAMGRNPQRSDRPALIRLLGDSSWLVKNNAVRALIHHGKSSVDDLVDAIAEQNPFARLGALEVIKSLKIAKARPKVIELLDDESGEVRSKAEEVLDALDGV